MAYYLRQDKKKKGLYLQMYESFWDKEKKQPRSRNIESFGYVSELISDEIPDPVSYYQKYVAEKNREHAASVADETRPRVFATQLEKNIGYFLVDSLLSELNVKETVDILALQKRFQFNLYDMGSGKQNKIWSLLPGSHNTVIQSRACGELFIASS